MNRHIIAFVCGFILDLIFGDPYSWPHPIRWIGSLISFLEKRLNKGNPLEKRKKGRILVLFVCGIVVSITSLLLIGAYTISWFLGVFLESIMTYQILALKSLKVESMKVFVALEEKSLEEARAAVSMIVGRDTQNLSDVQVTKAAIETVAENTSDGILAPMFYLALGGPILGFLYKSINTMDSMVGYKNEKYLDFGRFAAKCDDVVNYIPSRLSAVMMIVSTFFLGRDYSGKEALRIFLRDRYKHASPNSAQTESVCAGALQIQLAGPSSYFGKIVDKPYIGDAKREIEHKDILRANRLLYMASFLFEVLCVLLMKG
ncbi:MAG: cobalamin biosynthesis protein CobD, partial [Firmicutes bacterium]|nr:cobalamin biosynthesis protein CobD [Bacillota bacterium]